VTFHGSDINVGALNIISSLVTLFSAWNIFVAPKLFRRCLTKPRKHAIIPCGVDLDVFSPLEKAVVRRRLGLNPDAKYILFSSRFEVPVKNYPLALEAVGRLNSRAELLELKNRSRQEVSLLLNACDLLLMTSFHEGSPQIIKEAMACNCPIVSTDVGDVREVVRGTSGCFLTERNAADVAAKIETVFSLSSRTNGREHIRHLDNRKIAGEVFKVYQDVTACRRQ
jgi:glycosyltransferase involved in cell wall biosynthesis